MFLFGEEGQEEEAPENIETEEAAEADDAGHLIYEEEAGGELTFLLINKQ